MLLGICTLDVRQSVAVPCLPDRRPSKEYYQADRGCRRAASATEWDMQVTEALIGPVTQPGHEPELASDIAQIPRVLDILI